MIKVKKASFSKFVSFSGVPAGNGPVVADDAAPYLAGPAAKPIAALVAVNGHRRLSAGIFIEYGLPVLALGRGHERLGKIPPHMPFPVGPVFAPRIETVGEPIHIARRQFRPYELFEQRKEPDKNRRDIGVVEKREVFGKRPQEDTAEFMLADEGVRIPLERFQVQYAVPQVVKHRCFRHSSLRPCPKKKGYSDAAGCPPYLIDHLSQITTEVPSENIVCISRPFL